MSHLLSMETITAGPSTHSEIPYADLLLLLDSIPVVFSRWLFTCLIFIFVIPTTKDAEICGVLTALFIWTYDPVLTNMMGTLEELKGIFEVVHSISPLTAYLGVLLVPLGLIGLGTVFATMKRLWFGRFLAASCPGVRMFDLWRNYSLSAYKRPFITDHLLQCAEGQVDIIGSAFNLLLGARRSAVTIHSHCSPSNLGIRAILEASMTWLAGRTSGYPRVSVQSPIESMRLSFHLPLASLLIQSGYTSYRQGFYCVMYKLINLSTNH